MGRSTKRPLERSISLCYQVLMRRVANSQRVRVSGDCCLYCGRVATSEDNFPPVDFTGPYGPGLLLPACAECNSAIGSAHPTAIEGRVARAKAAIRRRYRKFLGHIEWSTDELEDMAPAFRCEYGAWGSIKRETHDRLAWNALAYLGHLLLCADLDHVAATLHYASTRLSLRGSQPLGVRGRTIANGPSRTPGKAGGG